MYSTWKKVLLGFQLRLANPICQRVPGLFGYLKLNRPMRFLLHDNCAQRHPITLCNIANFKFDQITSPELAINGKIEESQFTGVFGHL
jgi:hypothetical protein